MSSSYKMGPIGGKAFNHSPNSNAEAEYDRFRDLARAEANKHSACIDKSKQAYARGDGAAAHQLSEEGKAHWAKMDQYNQQASDYIFRQNNGEGRVADDTIDLHGQFVEEAANILEQRIRYAKDNKQTHLHVIVGKGNHSVNHIQKIKPRVEEVCRELGLQYSTEENAGRMYINLQGGPAVMPPTNHQPQHSSYQGGQQQYGGQQQGGYPGQQQGQQGGQQNSDNEELEKLAKKFLPKILRKLEGCCSVM